MTIQFAIPEGICIHNRDAWQGLAEKAGIDFDKKTWVYRDIKSGQYIIGQEVMDCSGGTDDI